MVYNIAICDDSKEYAEIVNDLINKVITKNNINCNIKIYSSGISLIQSFKEIKFDIIFLDMEMPEMGGIETGLLIREISENPIINYLTSHKEFAYDSYKVKARNYLLKPITIDVLEKELLGSINDLKRPFKLFNVKDAEGVINRIPINDITHILRKKEDRKIHIYTLDNKETVIVQTLENIEKMLSEHDSFKRSSKSCIVNLDNVKSINKSTIYFSNNVTEEASRRGLSSLLNLFKQKNSTAETIKLTE